MDDNEIWVSVPGWEACYAVSDLGRVRSSRTGRVLRPRMNRLGYARVGLCVDGVVTDRPIHQLVCEAFHGPRPDGMFACHNDGNPTNNRSTNLRWDTPTANEADKAVHGTRPVGERHWHAKLTNEQANEIRSRVRNGESQARVAIEFGVAQSSISRLATGRTWQRA